MNNSSSASLLQKLNDEKAILLIPAMVFVGVLMLTGFIGNIVVCYFYGCKTKTTPTSCFILGLAIFDLLSCTISMPMEIVDMRFFYMFPDVTVCKVLTATNFLFTLSSVFILIAIATERYRRICLPFRRQLTIFQARIICCISVVMACVFSWPFLMLYTVVTVDIPFNGSEIVKGYDCTTVQDESSKVYLNALNVMQLLLFIFTVVPLIVLYVLVYRQLIRMKQFQRCGPGELSVSPKPSENLNSDNSSPEKSNINKDTSNNCDNDTEESVQNGSKRANNILIQVASESKDMRKETSFVREEPFKLSENNNANSDESIRPTALGEANIPDQHEKESDHLDLRENDGADLPYRTSGKFNNENVSQASDISRPVSRYSSKKQRSTHINTVRYTKLMLIITVTFILSFIPYLCLVFWRSLATGYVVNEMTDFQLIFYAIGLRSFFMNCALNPMIYGFFNSQFRDFLARVCCACHGANSNYKRESISSIPTHERIRI